jgi:hypothetical protein
MIFMKKILGFTFLALSLMIIGHGAAAYSFSDNSGLNKAAKPSGYDTSTTNPQESLAQRIGQAISVVISFVGVLFLGLTIYGGYRWMMAGGNTSDVELAKKIITRAIIGLFVVLTAYTITAFVSNNLKGDLIQE